MPQQPEEANTPGPEGRPFDPPQDPLLRSRADVPSDAPAASIPRDAPRSGQVVGGYELRNEIGSGGFSVVWEARHVEKGDVVALKLPRVPQFVDHLRREALIAERFQDPQVVGVLEVCLDAEHPFLVMPYVPGKNLELPDEAPKPESIIGAFSKFRDVIEVVARLHAAGIVHGDLKPGNIRVAPTGIVHVLDLGLARHQVSARQGSTLRASVVSVTGEKIGGTLEFMAPEVLAGNKPTQAADVYALGILLHHLLCGRPPAFGVSPDALNPYLPPRTADFLRRTLHPEPGHRLPEASSLLPYVDDFIAAEERCLARRNGHARRRVFQERMATLARGVKVLLFTATALLCVFVGLPFAAALFHWTVSEGAVGGLIALAAFPASLLGLLMGITTINAWILGVPEKTYKNRTGHPLWTFMMQ